MTTRLFHCPSCGAPVTPRGNVPVINCPYCHASVVVPEELREISGVANWSTFLYDNFAQNDNNWTVNNQANEYFAKLSRTITEGRYRWEAHASIANSITTAWLTGYPVSDFHLIVNCKRVEGSKAGSSCGVIFRIQDRDNYYWFRITDNYFFAISALKDRQWQNLVDWTKTDATKPNGVNQLEVVAYSSRLTFLINGKVVNEMDDNLFSGGIIGLAVEAYTTEEKITFDFLDVILRAP